MKLPKDIIGRHKVRDGAICLGWERLIEDENYPTIESIKQALSIKFDLTELRIYQIVRTNHSYIPTDKEWEKKKRVTRLKIEIKKKTESNKDIADLLEQLRKEIEGDKPLIHNENKVTIVELKKVDFATIGKTDTKSRVLSDSIPAHT